jgi:hypothetical protein
MKQAAESKQKTPKSQSELDRIAQAAIEECRIVLPGIQALFGFQLIAGFNQGFGRLPATEPALKRGKAGPMLTPNEARPVHLPRTTNH